MIFILIFYPQDRYLPRILIQAHLRREGVRHHRRAEAKPRGGGAAGAAAAEGQGRGVAGRPEELQQGVARPKRKVLPQVAGPPGEDHNFMHRFNQGIEI